MNNVAYVIAAVGLLVFLAYMLTELFKRRRVPDLLVLILVGILLGPVLHVVSPDDFGAIGPIFTTITLVVILFEGGLGLSVHAVRLAMKGTLALTLLNFAVTVTTVGLLAHFIAGLTWPMAFMLGAINGGTSSAIVIPLVRQLRLRGESQTVLILESAITDVLCIVVTLGFLDAIRIGGLSVPQLFGRTLAAFLIAALFGSLGALAWSFLLLRVRAVPNSIFMTPAFVFIIYGVVEMMGFSGAIAALAFGIALGNANLLNRSHWSRLLPAEPISLSEHERLFFSDLVFLIKTFFFIYIGLSIRLSNPSHIALGALLAVVLFVLRIPVVRATISRKLPASDAAFMAVTVPKGLAAAVLASVPLQMGLEHGELIQNTTYAVVTVSILLNSILIYLLEKTFVKKVYERFFSGFAPSLEDES